MTTSTPPPAPAPAAASGRRRGMIASASAMASATPEDRNRVVDLLRAVSILVVVLGHWLVAGIQVTGGGDVVNRDVLGMAPWLHPATWAIQVMPVFFLVGGYANGLSWRSARARGTTYGGWLRARLRRLALPVVPLMLFWAAFAPLMATAGLGSDYLRIATTAALVPTWFLAAYVVVVAVAPGALVLWERFGWASVVGGVALAALVDVVSITTDQLLLGFLNYLVVWGTIHQLGYAWLDGALAGVARRALLLVAGLAVLVLLTTVGPYAVSMVGVEGYGINNQLPTRVTLVFLGMLQTGVVLLLEPALRRLASRHGVWTATILVNGRIMTLYLWHLTAMGIVIAASLALGGVGLRLEPLTSQWWTSRPLWLLVLLLTTLVLAALAGRFEQAGRDDRPAPAAWRPVLAVVGMAASLGVMAYVGIVDGDTVNWWLPLAPAAIVLLTGVAKPPRVLARA
jgi:fucose 4-O-acetylase-like acetyltransferase